MLEVRHSSNTAHFVPRHELSCGVQLVRDPRGVLGFAEVGGVDVGWQAAVGLQVRLRVQRIHLGVVETPHRHDVAHAAHLLLVARWHACVHLVQPAPIVVGRREDRADAAGVGGVDGVHAACLTPHRRVGVIEALLGLGCCRAAREGAWVVCPHVTLVQCDGAPEGRQSCVLVRHPCGGVPHHRVVALEPQAQRLFCATWAVPVVRRGRGKS